MNSHRHSRLCAFATRATCCLLVLVSGMLSDSCYAKPRLEVSFGINGLQRLSYDDVVLEDVAQNPSDAFHIWHMKTTTMDGSVLNAGQYGWGESNKGRQWDASTHTWTYLFTWGSIRLQYLQSGDNLDLNIAI